LIFQGFSDESVGFQSDLRQHFAHAAFGLLSIIPDGSGLSSKSRALPRVKHLQPWFSRFVQLFRLRVQNAALSQVYRNRMKSKNLWFSPNECSFF
jgi:hypothetical protein